MAKQSNKAPSKVVVPKKAVKSKNVQKTSNRYKLPPSPKPFTSENQPSPESKKLGWQKIREKRMLTKSIIDMMFGGDGEPKQAFKDYMKHLLAHAKDGHPLAMKTVNNAIEEEVSKVALTDADGNALPQVILNAIQAK